VKRAVIVLLALGLVLVARADEKPPRLSVASLPAAQTLSVKDVKESDGWFAGQIKKLESKGYNFIGWCYEKGKVVAKNDVEAFKWYGRSAELGDADGQSNLGRCYANGRGVAKDDKEAFKWLKKSADQENAGGQNGIGWCYANGKVVTKDEKEAFNWYTKSAEKGNAYGQSNLGWCYANGRVVAKDEKEAFKWFTKSAKQGNALGQNSLGVCYGKGIGVKKDIKEAFKWYTKSAEQGDANGEANLGWCYETGNGVVKDEKEAVKWYTKSADQGSALGQNSLGVCFGKGIGVPKDEREALKWYAKAAEQGNPIAQGNLGACYRDGTGVEKDEMEAVRLFIKSAEQGNAFGQGNLGHCYEIGKGVSKDEKEAVKWYTKAAEQGDAYSQTNLGRCLESGRGISKDLKEAFKWYTKSAEQGNANAKINLGRCYEEGKGVAKNEKEAVKWYTKAAEQGDADGQINLAWCYSRGIGLPADEKEAVKWYIKAADQGNGYGFDNLGRCYESGKGVAKDEKEAVKWYAKAAEQGNAGGQNNLGRCYETGKGVAKDEKEAVKWYAKAAEQGNSDGQGNLKRCYANGIGVPKNEFQQSTVINNAFGKEDEEKQELNGKPYFELSRDKMDKIEKKCETLLLDEKDLNSQAKQAATEGKLDKCLAILKFKEGAMRPAVIKACNLWMQDHKNPDEKIILRNWIKGLQNKYPEEIYPFYVEAIEQLFEKKREEACGNINTIISICESIINEPQKQEIQEIEKIRKKLKCMDFSAQLLELELYLFALGEESKIVSVNNAVSALVARTNDKEYQDAMRPAQKVFEDLQRLSKQKYDMLLQVIQNKQTDLKTFLTAADALMAVKAEDVCKELRMRVSNTALKAGEKIEIAKLFWRNGDTKECEDIVMPLLKASNQEASVWYNDFKKFKKGVPEDVSQKSIVRLVFPLGQGTGFFISNDGVIATAAHNFSISKDNPFAVQIFDYKNNKLTPSKIYIDPINDLALVLVKERPESNLSLYDGEIKAGTFVNSIGFPLSSVQSYYQSVQVVASCPTTSDILLSGKIMRGMSGGPVTLSNQVVGINASSSGATKGRFISEGINQLNALKVNETNAGSKGLDNNMWFQPEIIWCNYFSETLLMSDDELSMPILYETPRTFKDYCKKTNDELTLKTQNGSEFTEGYIKSIARKDNWNTVIIEKLLKTERIMPELIEYIESGYDKDVRNQKLEKILTTNPNFSPALIELANYSFLVSVGKAEEYKKLNEERRGGLFEFKFNQMQDTKSFEQALELMKRYWDTDPNLRWEFLQFNDGFMEVMKMYFTLKKIGPLLIAQKDGPLSDERLKHFAEEGNTLAMASLAERLIAGKEALSGYMFALKAAESGEPQGQSILAFYLLSGTAAAKNEKKGFEWALKSAEAGDPRGSTLAGVCLIQGIGTVPDKTKGMELLQIGIKGCDPTALRIAKNPGLETQIQFLPVGPFNNPQ